MYNSFRFEIKEQWNCLYTKYCTNSLAGTISSVLRIIVLIGDYSVLDQIIIRQKLLTAKPTKNYSIWDRFIFLIFAHPFLQLIKVEAAKLIVDWPVCFEAGTSYKTIIKLVQIMCNNSIAIDSTHRLNERMKTGGCEREPRATMCS